MKNAIAPKCPIIDCDGTFITKKSKRGTTCRQCNACGTFDGARFLTKSERAQQKREKAAKRAKKTAAQLREAERQAARQRALDVPQLPVEGWTPNDWFPGCVEERDAAGVRVHKRGNGV